MMKTLLALTALIFFLIITDEASAKLKFGKIDTMEGPRLAYYRVLPDGTALMEDDILVEPIDGRNYAKAVSRSRKSKLWKNGILPYEIDPTIPNIQRVYDAIATINNTTQIQMVPRTNQKDYVYFKENGSDSCSSYVGRKGGDQTINVPNWCGRGSLVHEILHALGFYHEQSRPDRNKSIRINWFNIKIKSWFNFFRKPFARGYGDFDFNSIMLYPSYNSFAIRPEEPTMVTRKGRDTWNAQRVAMSVQDLEALHTLYGF